MTAASHDARLREVRAHGPPGASREAAGYTAGLVSFDRIAMPSMPRVLLFVAVIAAPLAACGNKGPLVLPDKTPEQQQQDKDKKKDQPATAPQPAAKAGDAASPR